MRFRVVFCSKIEFVYEQLVLRVQPIWSVVHLNSQGMLVEPVLVFVDNPPADLRFPDVWLHEVV